MQNRLIRLLFAALLACSVATIPALAQGNGKAKGHDKKDPKEKGDDDRGPEQYQFRQQDREYVSSYYSKHGKSKGMPPGQAKKNGDLPPGLEKQLQRNGTLPPGLEKKMQPCPVEITRQLPPLPPDYQRGVVGASIVIYNRKTNIVVDVMADVVR
jgi:Ni/Co efflux regulator RcnB